MAFIHSEMGTRCLDLILVNYYAMAHEYLIKSCSFGASSFHLLPREYEWQMHNFHEQSRDWNLDINHVKNNQAIIKHCQVDLQNTKSPRLKTQSQAVVYSIRLQTRRVNDRHSPVWRSR